MKGFPVWGRTAREQGRGFDLWRFKRSAAEATRTDSIKMLSPFVTGPGEGLLWMCSEVRERPRLPPGAAVRSTGSQSVPEKSV